MMSQNEVVGMKKSLANAIGKAYLRLHCPHLYWRRLSSLEVGSFCRVMVECKACGKRKIDLELKEDEVLVEDSFSELLDRLSK